MIGLATGRICHQTHQIAHRQSPGLEALQTLIVGIPQYIGLTQADTVGIEGQWTAGGDGRIQLAQTSRRRIARIGKHLAPLCQGLRIPGLEPGLGHDNLAPHFQLSRPTLALQLQRDSPNGAHIEGNVLTGTAITTGSAAHQTPRLVQQAHRQAIKLGLGTEGQRRCTAKPFTDPPTKGVEPFIVKDVVQRQHGNGVVDSGEACRRLAPHPLGRGAGIQILGMRCLQGGQLAKQAIVFGIRQGGVIQHVVLVFAAAKLLPEGLDAG